MQKLILIVVLLISAMLYASVSINVKTGAGLGLIGGELEYRFKDHYGFFGGIGTSFETFSFIGGFRYYFANDYESGVYINIGGGLIPISVSNFTEEGTSFTMPIPLFFATGGYEFRITPHWKISAELGIGGGIALIIPVITPTLGASIGYTF